MNIFEAIARGPIDKYGTPNGRYGRISVTERHQQKLWSYQNEANQDEQGHTVQSWHWGRSAAINNGQVKEGDIVAIFNTREASYLNPIGVRHNTTTRREVASVHHGENGLTIKVRQIGSTGKGKGYRQYGTYDFAIL